MLTFRKMNPSERKACSQLAAASFLDYLFFTNYIEDEAKRLAFLQKLIDCEMRVNRGRTVDLVAEENGQIAALCTLCPPDFKKGSDVKYLMKGYLSAVKAGGKEDVTAWNDMNTLNDQPCHDVKDAWYINLLTIAPELRGQGIGTRMLKDCIIPYVKQQGGKTLTLVTNSEANRRFYERNGFTVFHEQSFEYKGRTTPAWSFRMEL